MTATHRSVKLLREEHNQTLVIPEDLALPGDEAEIRREGDSLVISPKGKPKKTLVELLDEWEPVDEELPEIDDRPPEEPDFWHRSAICSTSNEREFRRVEGLRVENWLA